MTNAKVRSGKNRPSEGEEVNRAAQTKTQPSRVVTRIRDLGTHVHAVGMGGWGGGESTPGKRAYLPFTRMGVCEQFLVARRHS